MICQHCKTKNIEASKFCTNCGKPLRDGFKKNNNNLEPILHNQNLDYSSHGSSYFSVTQGSGHRKPKLSRKKRLAIIFSTIGCVVVLAAIVTFLVLFNRANPVSISVEIPEYSDDSATRIPVSIKSADGDELSFINKDGRGLELKSGEYEIIFPSSPLTEDGTFYYKPDKSYKINVFLWNLNVDSESPIVFSIADFTNISEDDIEYAAEYANKDAESADKVEQYTKKTKAERQKYLAENKAKADKEAEENDKAERKAKSSRQLISGKYVSTKNSKMILELNLEAKTIKITNGTTKADAGAIMNVKEFSEFEGTDYSTQYGVQVVGGILDNKKIDFILQHSGTGLSFGHKMEPTFQDYDGQWEFLE